MTCHLYLSLPNLPPITPRENSRVLIESDSVDRVKLAAAITAPAIPTLRHPNLLIKALAMGATIHNK